MKIPKIKIKKKVNHSKKAVKEKKRGSKKNTILIILISMGIVIASAILAFALYIIITSPDFVVEELYTKEPTVLYDKNGDELTRIGKENVELVTYSDLPQVLVDALIATEDSRFFQHNGFDAARFFKASLGQLAGKNAGGASTLSMQVIKNTYTDATKTDGIEGIIRKFTDIYMAVFKLEASYTKEEIIEFYLNSQWLGRGTTNYASINGVEQASQYYFGKSVSDLTLSEASLLVGMFNAPDAYNPYKSPELASERRSTVLSLMVRHGYITEEEKEMAENVPVQSLLADRSQETSDSFQAFIDFVLMQVQEETGDNPYNTSMEIYTTLDPDIQSVLTQIENEEIYEFANDVVQFGMAVTSTEDGSVLAISGGRDYAVQGTNRGVGKKYRGIARQPGSAAKIIFDYGPYVEYLNGSSGTLFLDEAWNYTKGGSVVNADRKYWGEITMRRALVNSRNVPAIQAFQQVENEVGLDKIAEFAHGLGIDYGENLYESAGLGGFDGTDPLSMSAAYAAFGRGGIYIEPYSFTKVVYSETEEVYTHPVVKNRVMSEETAYIITDILVDAGIGGIGGNIGASSSKQIAAKGGTSTIDKASAQANGIPSSATPNHWNITYSPEYSIALWYGYDKNSQGYLTSSTGMSARKAIMRAAATRIYTKKSQFQKPSGVVSATVELGTYPLQLASEHTLSNLKVTELFKSGYEPTEVSSRFDTLKDPTNGKATYDGSTIKITWDAIETPDAINPSYLEEYFNGYFSNSYSQYAQKYYQARIDYNNANIGTIGYQVYLKDASGNLVSLGYTTNNYYTYTATPGTEYTFVIKSAYSIFKNNMSPGLTISAKTNMDSNIEDMVDPDKPNTSNKPSGGNTGLE